MITCVLFLLLSAMSDKDKSYHIFSQNQIAKSKKCVIANFHRFFLPVIFTSYLGNAVKHGERFSPNVSDKYFNYSLCCIATFFPYLFATDKDCGIQLHKQPQTRTIKIDGTGGPLRREALSHIFLTVPQCRFFLYKS